MTQGEIIHSPLGREQLVALAREAGLMGRYPFNIDQVERFAALVREDEREKLKQQLSKPDYMVDAPVVHPFKSGGRYDF